MRKVHLLTATLLCGALPAGQLHAQVAGHSENIPGTGNPTAGDANTPPKFRAPPPGAPDCACPARCRSSGRSVFLGMQRTA